MSIVEQAESELKRINFGAEDTEAMQDIMHLFFDQWDSGGAVSEVLPVLIKCISGKPLSPLTGTDDEWIDRSDMSGRPTWQNVRCSSVFKDGSGKAWNIDAADPMEAIEFPYDPDDIGGLAAVDLALREAMNQNADRHPVDQIRLTLFVGDLPKLVKLIEDRALGPVPPPVMVVG